MLTCNKQDRTARGNKNSDKNIICVQLTNRSIAASLQLNIHTEGQFTDVSGQAI